MTKEQKIIRAKVVPTHRQHLRHLKPLAASIALPASLLGHDPALAIINVTCGQSFPRSSPATVGPS
jgi:hypothetical protein